MKKNIGKLDGNAEIDWTLDENGCLTIFGTGKIPDYACGDHPAAPWNDSKESIETVVLEEGISEIGINAFRDCSNLKKVSLSSTVFRIHAYAFKNCTDLNEIVTIRNKWRYIYEESALPADREEELIFGVESFLNVPWAVQKWGRFYLCEDILYVCFQGEERLEIPSHIRVLKQFSFSEIEAGDLICPASVRVIEDFAFFRTKIRNRLVFSSAAFPEEKTVPGKDSSEESSSEESSSGESSSGESSSVENSSVESSSGENGSGKSSSGEYHIGEYSFADCVFCSVSFPSGWVPEGMKKRKMWVDRTDRTIPLRRGPAVTNKYYAGLEKVPGSERFKRIRIMKNKAVHHKNGRVTAIWDHNYIHVGKAMLHKLQGGRTLICVTHEHGRLLHVKAVGYSHRNDDAGNPETVPYLYLMYPRRDGGEILPWRDSFLCLEKEEITAAFDSRNGEILEREGKLRFPDPDVKEEWFLCDTRKDSEWWGCALELLRIWSGFHPEIRIDTADENKEPGRVRMTVSL